MAWLARLSETVGDGLLALRLPAIRAGAGTLLLSAPLVRQWHGDWRAQLLALTAQLVAPARLRIGAMLNIPVLGVLLCTATAYLVARAIARRPAEAPRAQLPMCREHARIDGPLARPQDTDLPVYVCREARSAMTTWWLELRRCGH